MNMDMSELVMTQEPVPEVVGRDLPEATTARAAARLLEYAHHAYVALPPHTTLEIIEHPVVLAVPGAAYYAYGLLPWQGRHIPMIDFDAVQRAHQTAHRIAAPRYALVVAYQSAPHAPLEHGAIGLAGLPQVIHVEDRDWCDLPTDSDMWPLLALSCFRYEGSVVPILDTARLFMTYHG
jgi:chemotaxis signal transduction protein